MLLEKPSGTMCSPPQMGARLQLLREPDRLSGYHEKSSMLQQEPERTPKPSATPHPPLTAHLRIVRGFSSSPLLPLKHFHEAASHHPKSLLSAHALAALLAEQGHYSGAEEVCCDDLGLRGVEFNGVHSTRIMFGRSTVWRNVCRQRDEVEESGVVQRKLVRAGSLANCPAGIDAVADAEQSVDAIFVTIDPGRLALAAAEDAALEVQLMERSQATTGPSRSACTLASESANGHTNGRFLERGCERFHCRIGCPSYLRVRTPDARRVLQRRAHAA